MSVQRIRGISRNDDTEVNFLVCAELAGEIVTEERAILEITEIVSKLEKLGARTFTVHKLDY